MGTDMLGMELKKGGQRYGSGRIVAFLLSGEAPFINGAIIPIDGAQSAKY